MIRMLKKKLADMENCDIGLWLICILISATNFNSIALRDPL